MGGGRGRRASKVVLRQGLFHCGPSPKIRFGEREEGRRGEGPIQSQAFLYKGKLKYHNGGGGGEWYTSHSAFVDRL